MTEPLSAERLMGLCKDCRWWNADPLRLAEINVQSTYGRCRLGETEYGEPVHPSTKAWASDGEMRGATLDTLYDFGCVQWSEVKR